MVNGKAGIRSNQDKGTSWGSQYFACGGNNPEDNKSTQKIHIALCLF